MKKILFLSFIGIALLSGCISTKNLLPKSEAYKDFYEEKPVTVLIMPPINQTANVDAKELFHTTLCTPISNAGYYVIPPFLSMEILKRESAYDSELFLDAPLTKFGELFGADLVLFTIIHKWDKTKLLGKISVEIEYIFKSVKTDEIVYQRKGDITVDPLSLNNAGNYLFKPISIIVDAATTAYQANRNARTDNAYVGSACNNIMLGDLPAGPYSPLNGNDGSFKTDTTDFKTELSGNAKNIQKQTKTWYSIYTKNKKK